MQLLCSVAIPSNLELKTRPKQLLVSLLLDFALPGLFVYKISAKIVRILILKSNFNFWWKEMVEHLTYYGQAIKS